MEVRFSPIRSDATLEVTRRGDALTINGETLDFAAIPDGGEVEVASPWVVGPVRRAGGRIVVAILLPHGPEAPEETRFPVPLIDPPDGIVALPPVAAPPDPIAE